MTTTLFLRIASVISLLFTLGHTMGGFQKWSPMGGAGIRGGPDLVHPRICGIPRTALPGWAKKILHANAVAKTHGRQTLLTIQWAEIFGSPNDLENHPIVNGPAHRNLLSRAFEEHCFSRQL